MKSYSVLADYYNLLTHNDCDYTRWSQYLFAVLGSDVKCGVDVACGTGKMTKLLCNKYRMTGVDVSSEMLSKANCPKAQFVRQNMLELKLPHKVDFAVIVNDGVNYVSGGNLKKLFRVLSNNLVSGGKLVFDVSSEYKITNVIGNNVFYYDGDDVTLLWTNKQTTDGVDMNVTLFEKDGDCYVRKDEKHHQYVHTTESIVSALSEYFEIKEITADYGVALQETSQRITFFAVKKGD